MSQQINSAFGVAVASCARLCTGLARDTRGLAAIEFALVAPAFFLFLFATIEISFIVWYQAVLNDGAHQAAAYLRDETMKCTRQGSASNNCTAATMDGVRQAICSNVKAGGISCDDSKLKIGIYSADDLLAHPVTTSSIIDNVAMNLTSSRAYIIALGYEWPFALPTSRLLLASSGNRVQLQARVYATTAEKALR